MLCPECGFDSSRDYGRYPTFGPVGRGASASAAREAWERKRPGEVAPPVEPEKLRKKQPRLIVAACAAMLALGIGIGMGLGGGKPDPTEPGDTVQVQTPHETATDPDSWRNNILRSDEVPDTHGDQYVSLDFAWETPVFGSNYRRDQISSVTFLDTLAEQPEGAWDVSEAGDGSVMAWVKPNGEHYDLYIGAEGGVSAGASCYSLFCGYENAERIHFGDAFHTQNVQDMTAMFSGCSSLRSLPLGDGFDTSNVQNMSSMFSYCSSLTELTLGNGFDTSNVQNMSSMFDECSSLRSLTLGNGFDTSNVRDMSWMFSGCRSLPELPLGDGFDTSNVQAMYCMFSDCSSLTKLTLGDGFVTTNADTTDMFLNCPAGADYQHLLD